MPEPGTEPGSGPSALPSNSPIRHCGVHAVTCHDREVDLVEAKLDDTRVGPILRTQAGGRHEPTPSDRLSDAAFEFRTELQREHTARALDDLREKLGQQDRAIAGSVEVLEAIVEPLWLTELTS